MQLKSDGISKSLRDLAQKSNRLPSYLANKACASITIRAERNMPRVNPSAISQELEVSVHGITKAGNLSNAKKPKNVQVGSHPNSLASLIILASFNKNSRFNIRTGGVFQRSKPITKGSAQFWDSIANSVSRMVKSRRSSTGFFKVCAGVVKFIFLDATKNSPLRRPPSDLVESAAAIPGSGNVSKNIGRLAGGSVAVGIRDSARATFWVATTEPDTKGSPGGAIYRIAQPVWQRGVDDESVSIKQKASEVFSDAARESGIKVV